MIYVVFFSNAGVPATGLTPTIGVYKKVSDGTDVTPAPTVSEIGGGFYKFTASPAEALVVRLNGGGSLAEADKYKVMQITPHDADLDAQVSTRGNQADLTAIKAKTDNLPAAPAAEGNVQGHVADAWRRMTRPPRRSRARPWRWSGDRDEARLITILAAIARPERPYRGRDFGRGPVGQPELSGQLPGGPGAQALLGRLQPPGDHRCERGLYGLQDRRRDPGGDRDHHG